MSTRPEEKISFDGWLEGGFGAVAGSGLPWLDGHRSTALARVRDQCIPDSRHEGWRYTSLKSLAASRFTGAKGPDAGIGRHELEPILIPGLDAYRVVLVNGRVVPGLSDLEQLPEGVRAGGLREFLRTSPDAVAGRLNEIAAHSEHFFSALNTAGMDDGLVLLVDGSAVVERPIEVIHLSVEAEAPRVTQPRHLVFLEEGARATLIERYVSLGEPLYCTNAVLELALGRDSLLDHFRVQTESPNAFHLTGLYLRQAEGSRYSGRNLSLGAAWSRTDLAVRFSGLDAECNLTGLYLAGDRQLVDYHLDVDHRVPSCISREDFKGIVYGKGRAVFDGRIHVAPDAQKTDARLSNRNLLLSRSAEVDTKPQLEIYADDVKCSHGTTVSQIEPEALFYLRSRGIPESTARRMVCLGFAREIIDDLAPEPLREHVAAQVDRRLDQVPLPHGADG